MSNASNQLIVLGNGFDLECGLPSRFANFYNEREPHLEEWLEADKNAEESHHINIWDYIFRKEKINNPSWEDVESVIQKWVETKPDSLDREKRLFISNFLNRLDGVDKENVNRRIGSWEEKIEAGDSENTPKLSLHEQAIMAKTLQLNSDGSSAGATCMSQLDFLFLQLEEMELAFEEYLSNKIDDIYKCNAAKLFDRLRLQDLELPSENVNTNVITFNYTTVPSGNEYGKNSSTNWCHVHGTVGDHNLIFGIDHTCLRSGDDIRGDVLQFTKTERVLVSPIINAKEQSVFEFPDNMGKVSYIKFYGHSLGDADYSYFKSIFDKVNLLNSNTKLLFYYPSDRLQERNVLYGRVAKLMVNYGNGMSDRQLGRNLMHRLLLEKRLKLVKLDVSDLNLQRDNSSSSFYMTDRQYLLMKAVKNYQQTARDGEQ